jgi:hypothetical protein
MCIIFNASGMFFSFVSSSTPLKHISILLKRMTPHVNQIFGGFHFITVFRGNCLDVSPIGKYMVSSKIYVAIHLHCFLWSRKPIYKFLQFRFVFVIYISMLHFSSSYTRSFFLMWFLIYGMYDLKSTLLCHDNIDGFLACTS